MEAGADQLTDRVRILIITNVFPPDRGGGAAVFGDLCYGLAALGHDVTLRCAYPYYPEWKDKSGRNGWRIWRYEDRGVHVERYGLLIPRRPSRALPRLAYELSFMISLLRSVFASRHYDVVMVMCPLLSSVVAGAAIKALYHKPLWLNVQDLAVEAAAGSRMLRHGLFVRLMQAVQRWLFNRADLWSTISPLMAERIAGHRRRGQPLLLLPNWMDDDLRREIMRLRVVSVRQPLRGPVRLLYGGNIGMKQNLLALLKALRRSRATFEFTVYGDGAQAASVREWIESTGDPRFRFGPFLDVRGFAEALLEADYFVITEAPQAGASFMPSKLVAGIAAGLPILTVADADGPLGAEVIGSRLGPWFSWQQLDELCSFLESNASDPGRYRDWAEHAVKRALDFERDRLIARFSQVLVALAAGQTPRESDYAHPVRQGKAF